MNTETEILTDTQPHDAANYKEQLNQTEAALSLLTKKPWLRGKSIFQLAKLSRRVPRAVRGGYMKLARMEAAGTANEPVKNAALARIRAAVTKRNDLEQEFDRRHCNEEGVRNSLPKKLQKQMAAEWQADLAARNLQPA